MRFQPLESFHSAYPQRGKDTAFEIASNIQIKIRALSSHNRSGSAVDAGLCVKLSDDGWKIFQVDDSETPKTVDVDAAVKAGTATNIFTTTTDDGFLFQAYRKFNLLGLTVSQAETGSPVYVFEYFNGTSFVTLPTISVPTSFTVQDEFIAFQAPLDWAVGAPSGSDFSNVDADKFTIKVTASTAPATAVQINDAWAGYFLEFQEALADNSTLSVDFEDHLPLLLRAGENVIPYYGAASANNVFSGYYSPSG